jgi:hypothetical protein
VSQLLDWIVIAFCMLAIVHTCSPSTRKVCGEDVTECAGYISGSAYKSLKTGFNRASK